MDSINNISAFPWITRANACNVHFIGTLVLFRNLLKFLADFAYKLRDPLTVVGSMTAYFLLKTYNFVCLWITQTAPYSTKFVADTAKLPVLKAILSITVF